MNIKFILQNMHPLLYVSWNGMSYCVVLLFRLFIYLFFYIRKHFTYTVHYGLQTIGFIWKRCLSKEIIFIDTHKHFFFRSSIDSLLESRQADPVDVLLSLGFGAQSQEGISRIPDRFLRPSQVCDLLTCLGSFVYCFENKHVH